jgi:hypothetical protein
MLSLLFLLSGLLFILKSENGPPFNWRMVLGIVLMFAGLLLL